MTPEEELKQVQERKSQIIAQCNGELRTLSNTLRIEFRELRGQEEWLNEYIKHRHIRARKLREQANLGDRFATRTFESFDETKQNHAYRLCKAYAERYLSSRQKERNSIVLIGNCGTGKTHLLASITNYVIENFGTMVLFATWSDHLEKLKTEFKSDKRGYLEEMKSIDLLVIDDFGQEKRSKWTDEILFSVVNTRYERCLPILISTNLISFDGSMQPSAQSRLTEMAVSEVMTGEDYRNERGS